MKIISIASARPNFVKLAAVHHAIIQHAPDWEHLIVHTGQHYDPLLSDVFFKELGIPQPQVNLGVKGGGDNEDTVKRTKEAIVPTLQEFKPDLVIVYGDVSGALAGALAAHDLKIPVAHVEAGLRSFDNSMPEEGNRIAIDRIAKLLFVTEKSGLTNLENENVTEGVHFVGNTMIDTLVRMRPNIDRAELPSGLPARCGVVTLHRPSNVDNPMSLGNNIRFLNAIAEECCLVFPVHPRTRWLLQPQAVGHLGPKNLVSTPHISVHAQLHLIDPLNYLSFLRLLSQAEFILTDSGGIQEEATFLGKRCFTLRKNTERPSTIEAGSNVLIDLEKNEDKEKVLSYAKDPKPLHVHIPELWDGKAGERILRVLTEFPRV